MTASFDTYLVKIQADFGYDADRIAAERTRIEAFDQANQAQEMAKGVAQRAAPARATATRAVKKA